jgi:hypothetical protein
MLLADRSAAIPKKTETEDEIVTFNEPLDDDAIEL